VTVFTGGADHQVKMWNVTQGSSSAATLQTIGSHDAPVKAVKFNADKSMILSASWDKTVSQPSSRS
jgi:WD40 repeat protein